MNLLINVKLKLEISTYFCGLLRIYELYVFYGFHDFHGFSFLHFYNAKRPIQTYSINFSYSAQWGEIFPEGEFLFSWNNVFTKNVFNLHNISISMFHENLMKTQVHQNKNTLSQRISLLCCSVSVLKALRYIGKQLMDRGVSRKILTYSSKKIGKHLTDRGVSRQCPPYSSKNNILANMSIKKKYNNF